MQWQWMKEDLNGDGEKTYTNMIMSTGSKIKNKKKTFCLTFYKIDSIWKQRVKIDPCNVNDQRQKWRFFEGKIVSLANPNLCMGFETRTYRGSGGQVAVTMASCFNNAWGHLDGKMP